MPKLPATGNSERTTQSAADGTFSFEQVPPGQYILQVDFTGFERASQEIAVSAQPQTIAVNLEALEIPGAEAATQGGSALDTQARLHRIRMLESRTNDLESGTVLSTPETRMKRCGVYV